VKVCTVLKARFNREEISMAGKYWIKSLSEWAPEEPVYPHDDLDDVIKSIERIRQINQELRDDLDKALNIIRCLDWRITELKAELSLLKEEQ
jgi:hypothetical protein